jgi:hypothetical protein
MTILLQIDGEICQYLQEENLSDRQVSMHVLFSCSCSPF